MDGSDNPNGGWLTRATPENQQETATAGSSEAIRQPSRSENEMKRWSTPYGDVGDASWKKLAERNSLSGRWNLPLQRVIAEANPANNGEAPTHLERVIPWEVESLRLFDPVTSEAKAEMEFLSQGKSMNSIRRRPSEPGIDICSYISGYVDGEGCFCVSLRPQPRIRVGWEVRPSFSVSQNGDRAELIKLFPILFGSGTIRPDRSDKTLKFEIRSLRNLNECVIPFFERFPLLSSKRKDFELFRRICRLMEGGTHLMPEGVVLIANLAQQMNSGVRKYTAEMITESFRGEGIVCAAGNSGST